MDGNIRYKKSPDIVSRKIADEFVLVPIRKNTGDLETIYTLNEVGAEIWEKLDGEITLSQMCAHLADTFDISLDQAQKDLNDFIKDLNNINCIYAVS